MCDALHRGVRYLHCNAS